MRLASFATMAATLLGSGAATEEPCTRSFFCTGGSYVDDGKRGHIFRDQMYVEKLLPVNGATQGTPVVLIHGQAQTGTVSSILPSSTFDIGRRLTFVKELAEQARRRSRLGFRLPQSGI